MPRLIRIGRIVLWFFAGLGVIYTGVFFSLWAKENVPGGIACKITKYEELRPGSPQYKAAELVRKRAIQKFPQIDFSKREVKIALDEGSQDVWIVRYDESHATMLGCERFRLDEYNIAGEVRKRDLTLQGDVEIVGEPVKLP